MPCDPRVREALGHQRQDLPLARSIAPAVAGATLSIEGAVTAVEQRADSTRFVCELVATDQDGQAAAPDAEFQFVNIARWRTAEDFRKATRSPEFREVTAGLAAYRSYPAVYQMVRG